MSYQDFLNLWQERLDIQTLKELDELLDPDFKEFYRYGLTKAQTIGDALGLKTSVGGSILVLNNKSTLLKGDRIDIDMRIWVSNKEELERAGEYLSNHFQVKQIKDHTFKKDIHETGLPAYLYIFEDQYKEKTISFEVQIRKEPSGGYHGMAKRRLEELSDQELKQYLNIKGTAKKQNKQVYDSFKSQESQFWKIPEGFSQVMESIHNQVLRTKQRKGGKSQTDHMASVAYKVLALGGNFMDFTVGFLHDCLEMAVDPDKAISVIKGKLKPYFDEEEISEIVYRIQLLTEEKPSENSPDENYYSIIDTIQSIAAITRENIPQKEVDFILKYIRTYQDFHHKIMRHQEKVATVEIADRWDGLLNMDYLSKLPFDLSRYISLMRQYHILKKLNAPDKLFYLIQNTCKKYNLQYEMISQYYSIFDFMPNR